MTNKTINGVPREFADRAISVIDRLSSHITVTGKDLKEGRTIADELRALLAAPDPIVEADGIGEPVAWQRKSKMHGNCWYPLTSDEVKDGVACGWEVRSLYSADQLAALQSTITRLESEAFYAAAGFQAAKEEIAQLKAENERLRAEADQNVEWEETFGPDYTGDAGISASVKLPVRNDASKDLDLEQCGYVDGWNACLDEVRRMNP